MIVAYWTCLISLLLVLSCHVGLDAGGLWRKTGLSWRGVETALISAYRATIGGLALMSFLISFRSPRHAGWGILITFWVTLVLAGVFGSY
jgi:hypothetical protein